MQTYFFLLAWWFALVQLAAEGAVACYKMAGTHTDVQGVGPRLSWALPGLASLRTRPRAE